MNFLNRWQPQLLSVLRIMSALVFLQHGTTKFFHFPPNPAAGGRLNTTSALNRKAAARCPCRSWCSARNPPQPGQFKPVSR